MAQTIFFSAVLVFNLTLSKNKDMLIYPLFIEFIAYQLKLAIVLTAVFTKEMKFTLL